MCLMGAIQGTVVALGMEWGNPAAWSLRSESMIVAALYSVSNSYLVFLSIFWQFFSSDI